MGQRSQIYIRWNITNGNEPNYRGLIARYYDWCFGERMVSRARAILELLNEEFLKYPFLFDDPWRLKKLERFCDVNFDMRDIMLSTDIVKEVEAEWNGDSSHLFEQQNTDGQLFIDVTDKGIQYCFVEYCYDGNVMDAEQYMKWDCENEDHPDWHMPRESMGKETIQYTERNIEEISKLANVMTEEERKDFLEADYDFLFAPKF